MEIEAARRVRWSFKGDFLNFEDAVYFPSRILDRGATQDSKSSIGVTPSSRLLLKSSYVYFVWVSVSVTRFPYNIPNYYTWFNIAIKTLTRNFHFLCYCTCMQMHFLQRDILACTKNFIILSEVLAKTTHGSYKDTKWNPKTIYIHGLSIYMEKPDCNVNSALKCNSGVQARI